mgnify:CR=1 FL=1
MQDTAIRVIKLLSTLKHDNIVSLREIVCSRGEWRERQCACMCVGVCGGVLVGGGGGGAVGWGGGQQEDSNSCNVVNSPQLWVQK